ncbi:MAG: DUF3732 domain-containing protein, partial [Sedimentisphaerales bacterium]|nr:DUF3732 domain-containing protein [Sedimentisphaerales bacterium]
RRQADTKHAFIKLETDLAVIESKDSFVSDFFEDEYFIPLADFKKTLRRYFGSNIQITDIDESQEERHYRGNRKKPTPSVRSFTSFMLQHQNLVANKHAIFYRFDEKEKREQTIEHFKVFAGFADQEYFLKKQELEKLTVEKRQIELQIPRQSEVRAKKKGQIHDAQKEYVAISGRELDLGDLETAMSSPQIALDAIISHKVDVVAMSEEHAKFKLESERALAQLTAEYRKQQNLIKDIESSIEFAENYQSSTSKTIVPQKAELHASQCPFCQNHHDSIERQANELTSAIDWLNDELQKSHYSLDSFREDLQKAQNKLNELGENIRNEKKKIQEFDSQIEELDRYRTQHELALKAKLKIESYFEELLGKPYQELEQKLSGLKKRIKEISKALKDQYSIEKQLEDAEAQIATYMAEITSSLDFEDSYKPIQLRFSLETFDLWNEKDGRRIYLRSMGSGANWLSCHIALFLALNKYFCKRGDKCAIPTTVFFDQPSQVYFPSILDADEEFSAKNIAEKEGATRKRPVDEDVTAVTNLYSEFARFCQTTLENTRIEPQIIVTDHADKLRLSGDYDFESFVRARWRAEDEGFIKLKEELKGSDPNSTQL